MGRFPSPPSSSTPTPTAPHKNQRLLKGVLLAALPCTRTLTKQHVTSKANTDGYLTQTRRPAALQVLGEYCSREGWPVGEPHWHKRRRHQEGLHDQGAVPYLVPPLCHQPAARDVEGWSAGHPNL